MPERGVFRGSAARGYATATNAPLRVDSTTNQLKIIPGGTGTTEYVIPVEQPTVSGQAATVTLTQAQDGATCYFDSAAGIIYTLPAPVVGTTFTFVVTVSVTSNLDKVITSAGSVFLIGTLIGGNTASADAMLAFTATSTTAISIIQKSTGTNATGGLIGSWFSLKCISSTLWLVTGGFILAGTTFTTPFSAT